MSEHQNGGIKFDDAKAPWYLLPWDALLQVVLVLAFGAKKYAARNWEKGLSYSRVYGALQRHLVSWWQFGENTDPETGLSHLAHAMCCIMFLLAYVVRGGRGENGVPLDDRPRVNAAPCADPAPVHRFSAIRHALARLVGCDIGASTDLAWETAFLFGRHNGNRGWARLDRMLGLSIVCSFAESERAFRLAWNSEPDASLPGSG